MRNITINALIAAAGFAGSQAYASCPEQTDAAGSMNNKPLCVVSGNYKQDLVLTSDNIYVLSGGVFIGGDNKNNATLTIQPGTKVVGQSGADYLVITRGSKIMAEGTKEQPIVFTSARQTDRDRGLWGGLIINGNAPINNCANGSAVCEAEGEGNSGLYGGDDAFDSSGVLKYVRVEFAGYEITPDNELNGIAFQGVGSGTVVDYIQVHMNADDGIEFFGGTVNAKHVLLTGNKDDSLDWTNGWTGMMQYVIVKQFDDAANHGIEADNLSSPQNAEPRSNPTIANMTLLGTTSSAAKGGSGMVLRRGTGGAFYNTVIKGFKSSCINVDDAETFNNGASLNGAQLEAKGLSMVSSVVDCSSNFSVDADDVWNTGDWFTAQSGNKAADAGLNGWVPVAGSVLLSGGQTPFDLFFDEVDYIGAVKSAESDWTVGWTISATK